MAQFQEIQVLAHAAHCVEHALCVACTVSSIAVSKLAQQWL